MNWNKDNTLLFIDLIRERPVIWDASLSDHKNKNKKYEAIEEVSKLMGISTKEVNTKWTSLRGQYNREKKKSTDIRTGSGADALQTSKWFAYNDMESLMGCNIPQDSFCNIVNSKEETTSQCTYTATPTVPTPPPITLTQPPTTSTSPPTTPTPPPITPTLQSKSSSAMKKKRVGSTGLQAEALRTLKVIRDRKRESHSTVEANDDISAFGSYISAQLRQFGRRLQTKAKLEINKLLYNIELEHLESTTSSSIERSQSSNLSNYLEFEDSIDSSSNQPLYSMPDDSVLEEVKESQYELTANTSELPALQQPVIYIKNDGTIHRSPTAQTSCNASTPNNSVVILDDAVLSPPTTQAALSPEAKETLNAIEHLLKYN